MKVLFQIQRFNPQTDPSPHWESYNLELMENQTVLDGLISIQEEQDGSLAFRRSCRSAICGSCAMFINGAHRLACKTGIGTLNTDQVFVSPLPHLAVLKDLVVDMAPFFQRYEQILPYLVTKSPAPERERLQSPEQRRAITEMIDCILCGACYSACPMVWTDREYIGPAALTKAYRFVADSRDEGAEERLKIVDSPHGVWRCHTIHNCARACPKNINPTWSIQELKKKVVAKKLRFWR